MVRSASRFRAVQMLLLASLFWGASFPLTKALGLAQQELLPESGTWFLTSVTVLGRFGLAALVLLVFCFKSLKGLTWLEIKQGVGLGIFGGLGLLFQVDGLAYTSASTSAFLTQCHCLFVPLMVAITVRRRPALTVLFASFMVMAGVAILAGVDWTGFQLGRGESQTLIGAMFFSGQILMLDRRAFDRNRPENITWVMFVTMASIGLPLAWINMSAPADLLIVFSTASTWVLLGLLVLFCTLLAFGLMNRWQPAIPASEAALIYAAEPVFATLFALFLPGFISALTSINYGNESFTAALLTGGALIVAANFLLQWNRAPNLESASGSAELARE
jgi:drug/metabolite transporter (DMT)-like permease